VVVLLESIVLDNLKIFNLAMKTDVPTGHHGLHGVNAPLHVDEELRLEHVNVLKKIDVSVIMKMLISVAEMNVHHGLNGAITVHVLNHVGVV